jgi:hypothetical protein
MNMEELSKSQLLLLMILVNFVTSVATGIITVSLLDQAPPVVTQTVQRVVDHTIETVTQPAAVVVASKPSPSAQDLTTSAFAALAARRVFIYDGASGTSTAPIEIGTFLPTSQIVATAAITALPQEALVVFSDGSSAPASLAKEGEGVAVYGFGAKAVLPKEPSTTIVPVANLEIGETLLALGASGAAEVGILSQIDKESLSSTLSAVNSGPSVVDLSGNFVGIISGASAGDLISAASITSLLTASSTATTTPSGA